MITIFANRCGEEPGKVFRTDVEELGVRYAGTSWIGRVGQGKVKIGGIMGRNEEGVLLVDTDEKMQWELVLAAAAAKDETEAEDSRVSE